MGGENIRNEIVLVTNVSNTKAENKERCFAGH